MKNIRLKISVVIPMYNSSETIIRSLKSVVNQSFQECDYEVIIVNDGSKDNSEEVVEDFIRQSNINNFFYKLINQENGGVSKARNIGLRNCTGEFIAFLDSDDYWNSNKIERQMLQIKENSDIDLIATNRNNEVFDKVFGISFKKLNKISSHLLLYKNFLSPPTVLMRRSILENVGYFDENQRFAEEGDYWIRICNKKNCYLLNESLVITGDGKPHFGFSGLSSNLWQMEKGELKNIKTAYKMNIVTFFEYVFLVCFSFLKYIRRVVIVKLR